MFNLGSLAPVISVKASLIILFYSLSKDHSHVLSAELFIIVIIAADDMFGLPLLSLQPVPVRPHGCVRQPARLRPRNSDCLQSQQPQPGRQAIHTAQLVSRVAIAILTSFILHVSL